MKAPALVAALIAALSSLSFAQERPVPKDSQRLSIAGCARGRVFTVGRSPEHELRGTELQEGRKIRLEGPKEILAEIQRGEFAKEFILENRSGGVSFNARRRQAAQHPMEEVGAKLRALMPWLKENRLVDRSKN